MRWLNLVSLALSLFAWLGVITVFFFILAIYETVLTVIVK